MTQNLKVGSTLLALLCMLAVVSGCGGNTGGGSTGGGTTAPTVSITASAATITLGQTETLTVTSSNATSCTGSGSLSGSVTCNGTIVVTPTATGSLTYTVNASGSGGNSTASVNVTVNAATPTISSVSTACSPSSILTTQTSTCTATVQGTGAFSSAVTWSATGGSITSGGVFTPSGAGTAVITATSAQAGYTNISGSTNVVVATPTPTISSVSTACSPSSILTTQTSTCTATVQGTGAFSSAVTWSATGGSITSGGVFTPSGAGTAVITATSAQAGYTNISGSTNVVVATPTLAITSIGLPWMYCDAECGIIVNVPINGTGFQSGDTISSNPSGYVYTAQYVNSTQILISLPMDTPHTSPGWLTFTVTSPDGTKSSSISIAYIGNQNMLALSPSGELNYFERSTGVIWQYKANGTADGSVGAGSGNGIAVDDKTGNTIKSQPTSATLVILGQTAGGNGNPGMAVAAKNGNGCVTEPDFNLLGCIPIASTNPTFPPFNSATINGQPFSVAMGLFGTETDAFVYSRDGNPVLWKVNVSGGMTLPASQSIAGMTSWTTLHSANPYVGGWQVAVFDKGSAANTVAVLSTADNLLVFFNTSTMAETKRVTLSGIPFRIAADTTNGNLIVAYADTAHVLTTFAAVNPTTGVVTPLTSTSALLAVGFQTDGINLFVCQRIQCAVIPNK